MKILIEARFLGPEGTGVGTYVDNLLSSLLDLDKKNEYVVLLKKSNFNLFNPKNENFKKLVVDAHWYSAKEQVLIPLAISKERPDLVHFPHFNVPLAWRGKFVVTIHDLIISQYGKDFSRNKVLPVYLTKRFLYNVTLRKALRSSEKIITPSDFVKKQLIKDFNVPKGKIAVTHEAAGNIFIERGKKEIPVNEKNKTLISFGIKQPFILTVGNLYPYKNILTALKTLKSLPRDISLVHVSKRNSLSNALEKTAQEFGLGNRFILTGSVGKKELSTLYRLARIFVAPSFSEGFGLPGLEVMASRCPVVCSDIEVFREIYGEAALFFDPHSSKDLAEKVLSIMNSGTLRENMIELGLKQVGKYSWRKTAEETLKIYQEASAKNK